MESITRVSIVGILVCSVLNFSLSEGRDFYVGGKKGWVPNPSESFNHWAERNRFQVNDTLIFKYEKNRDSVLIVSKENYNICNTKEAIEKMGDGESKIKLDRSGPFFFISGNQGNCEKGQKMITVVMSLRPKNQPISSPPTSSPPALSPTNGDSDQDQAPSPASSFSPSLMASSTYSILLVLLISVLVIGNFPLGSFIV